MKHVVLYARRGTASFEAVALGCGVAGYRVTWLRPNGWQRNDVVRDADVVIVQGQSGNARDIRETYEERDVPVWIIDLPRLRNEPDAHALLNGSLHWLPKYTCREPFGSRIIGDREDVYTLVAMQMPGDHAHGMNAKALNEWTRRSVEQARRLGVPVRVRPHPLSVLDVPADLFGADEISDPKTESLVEAFHGAAQVVVHNSTVGWDAIAAGVPVISEAHSGFQEYLGELDDNERHEALCRAASSQWTLTELADGTAVRACFEGLLPLLPGFDPLESDAEIDDDPDALNPDTWVSNEVREGAESPDENVAGDEEPAPGTESTGTTEAPTPEVETPVVTGPAATSASAKSNKNTKPKRR
ncbi:MAG: hypothetical protein ACO1Q7_15930 [Gemmatimonas sp.]